MTRQSRDHQPVSSIRTTPFSVAHIGRHQNLSSISHTSLSTCVVRCQFNVSCTHSTHSSRKPTCECHLVIIYTFFRPTCCCSSQFAATSPHQHCTSALPTFSLPQNSLHKTTDTHLPHVSEIPSKHLKPYPPRTTCK